MPLHDFRSVHLPYCLEKQEDGSYVVLNREYAPIGFTQRKNYNQLPIFVKIKNLTPKLAEKLSYKKSNDTSNIYLYNDGSIPTSSKENMQSYLDKLALLAELQFHTEDQ